jgi:hypothetical protein
VQTLASDRQWVGGTPGILAVLHTWSRTLAYHPHAHLLVTAGGLTADGTAWVQPAHPRFLAPGYMLSEIFRAKLRHALTGGGLEREIDPTVWTRNGTVHVQRIGRGTHAALYLSRYVYRVALTNQRLTRCANGQVTFRYTHARTRETRRLTLPVQAFLARFLQHVLPRGFPKIRSYGLLSPSRRGDLEWTRHLLQRHAAPPTADTPAPPATTSTLSPPPDSDPRAITAAHCCPVCQRGQLHLVERVYARAPP